MMPYDMEAPNQLAISAASKAAATATITPTMAGRVWNPWAASRTRQPPGAIDMFHRELDLLGSQAVPLNLVRAAVLAASAHNTQPWLYRLTTNRVDLYAVTARNIGTIDSLRREMYISLGWLRFCLGA